ncbi:glutamate-gated chloride channel-like [Varroa jacobsoni]|uniref:Neurotransmitter-gated ion-channel ligand-binding domain-containing protein n=1 Tax=Varroa destructor TaxID=109461 RepID=A0A7M7JKR0_VARDE|nr:glutamate-gated chloride channel-like [Varroa destructor]XP_022708519.1 glutamate-gated chloride channel-like [Varroa jacobsoni]
MRRTPTLLPKCASLFIAAAAFAEENWDNVLERYNPLEKPPNPTEVHINMFIRSMRNFDSNDQSFQAQIILWHQWNEPRLIYGNDTVPYQMIDRARIWKPDTFFTNELDGWRHSIVKDNALVRVYPNGDILMSERLSLTLMCPINLAALPFDSQVCSIRIASYGYTTDSLIYTWKEGDPIQVSPSLYLPGFRLTQFDTDYCTSQTSIGEYPCLRAEFTFKRIWNYHLLQVYIPMTMLCVIAWFTFWVNDTLMRITMLMFTLALAVLETGVINYYSFPCAGSTKTIDYFTGVGITFIFGALAEYVIVKWLEGKEEKETTANRMDALCRILYPIAYIGFVALYFLTVLPKRY